MQRRPLISALSIVIIGLTVVATLAGLCPALAEDSAISMRRAAERTNFSNDEIKDGFFKTANPFACLSTIMACPLGLATLQRSSKTFALGSIISIWL
jgi:hypothetical protein